MSVYFVLRSQYKSPNICQIKTFADKTVLSWFQRIWRGQNSHESYEYVESLLGFRVYGFATLFQSIKEHELRKPNSSQDLADVLTEHLYVEGEIKCSPHAIQVLTDDDELELAYYIFDDTYVKSNKAKCAFLLQKDFLLPINYKESAFAASAATMSLNEIAKDGGTVFCVFMAAYEWGGNITEMSKASAIHGIRLPEMAEYLGTKELGKEIDNNEYPCELLLLRSQLLTSKKLEDIDTSGISDLRASHNRQEDWQQFYSLLKSKGIEDPKRYVLRLALESCADYPVHQLNNAFNWSFAGSSNISITRANIENVANLSVSKNNPTKSLIQVEEHMAQVSIHTDTWSSPGKDTDLFNRWVFFDDRWAAANQDIANALLRFQERWDVLTIELSESDAEPEHKASFWRKWFK